MLSLHLCHESDRHYRRSDSPQRFAVQSPSLSVWADTAVDTDATDTAEPRRSATPISGLWAVCERAERCERAEEIPAGCAPLSLLLLVAPSICGKVMSKLPGGADACSTSSAVSVASGGKRTNLNPLLPPTSGSGSVGSTFCLILPASTATVAQLPGACDLAEWAPSFASVLASTAECASSALFSVCRAESLVALLR